MSTYPIHPAADFHFLTPLYDFICGVTGYGAGFKRRLLHLAGLEPHHRVLDVGCGSGTLAVLIRENLPAVRLQAVDPDRRILRQAQRKATRRRMSVALQTARAEALPFPGGTFDRILSSLTYHHIPDDYMGAALAETRRVLKSDGRFLLADFETATSRLFRGKGRSTKSLEQWLRAAGFEPRRLEVRRGVHVWMSSQLSAASGQLRTGN